LRAKVLSHKSLPLDVSKYFAVLNLKNICLAIVNVIASLSCPADMYWSNPDWYYFLQNIVEEGFLTSLPSNQKHTEGFNTTLFITTKTLASI